MENVYAGNDFNSKEAKSHAIDYIKVRIECFIKHPGYTFRFFAQKLISIWGKPTFQGLWINNNTELVGRDYNVINHNLFYGPINFIIVIFLYAYELLLISLTTFYLIVKRKNLDYIKLSLRIIIAGGFFPSYLGRKRPIYTKLLYTIFTLRSSKL